jgi:predicted nucleotidyltransferase component of viral defense system
MTAKMTRPASEDTLFLWIMHRFAEVFEDHAVIKGGMFMKLLDSPRHTMDIDYVFVPFKSKKEILGQIEKVLNEIEGATVSIEMHSKMLRANLRLDDAAIMIEANVATECATIPMATGGFAHSLGQPSQIVRVMEPALSLAHKIAAWNERRLMRDLYDCYFLVNRTGTLPDLPALDSRLANVQSRLPRLRKKHQMSRAELVSEIRQAATDLTGAALEEELAGVLPPEELSGLDLRIRTAVGKISDYLLAE